MQRRFIFAISIIILLYLYKNDCKKKDQQINKKETNFIEKIDKNNYIIMSLSFSLKLNTLTFHHFVIKIKIIKKNTSFSLQPFMMEEFSNELNFDSLNISMKKVHKDFSVFSPSLSIFFHFFLLKEKGYTSNKKISDELQIFYSISRNSNFSFFYTPGF